MSEIVSHFRRLFRVPETAEHSESPAQHSIRISYTTPQADSLPKHTVILIPTAVRSQADAEDVAKEYLKVRVPDLSTISDVKIEFLRDDQ